MTIISLKKEKKKKNKKEEKEYEKIVTLISNFAIFFKREEMTLTILLQVET